MSSDKRTVTAKRLAANQAAAQKSTGPKTEEGKQRAAFNSFQHGAFAQKEHTLQQAFARSGDDPSELAARREQLLDDWQPATHQQELLVGDLAWLYWLRDQAATALVEGQARQRQRAELERDQRRFNARHRTSGLTLGDCQEGCVNLPDSEAKFTYAAEMLDELEARLVKANWTGRAAGFGLASIHPWELRSYLWGGRPNARGEKVGRLWNACEKDKAKAGDPRAGEIRALLEEERAALAEEAELFRRQQEFEIEQPQGEEFSGLHPLGEAWQRAVLAIERLDRQINAKIRLLLRLRDQKTVAPASCRPLDDAGIDCQAGDDGGLVAQRSSYNAAAFREAADKPQGQTTDPALQTPPEDPRHEPRAVATTDEGTDKPQGQTTDPALQTPPEDPRHTNRAVATTKIDGTKPIDPLESTALPISATGGPADRNGDIPR